MLEQCPRCGEPAQDDLAVCPRCNFIRVAEAEYLPGDLNPDEYLPPGTILEADYRVVSVIGSGGSGVVYEARQLSLQNARVALKVLHPDLSDDETTVNLLKREVIVSRELTHHNIMKVYNFVQNEDRYFIVMEYVLGGSLQSRLESKGVISMDSAAQIFYQACDALEYAHNRGVIHLDIKPANLLLGPNNMVKLCDFGIARMAVSNVTTATQRIITGSVGYMPPEQYRGRKFVSTKSDIYSLAATLYTALTGEAPIGIIDREGLPECVVRAMNRDPEQRFESVQAFKQAFESETGIAQMSGGFLGTVGAASGENQGSENQHKVVMAGSSDTQTEIGRQTPHSEYSQPSTQLEKNQSEEGGSANDHVVSQALTVAPTQGNRLSGQDSASILVTKRARAKSAYGRVLIAAVIIVLIAIGYVYYGSDLKSVIGNSKSESGSMAMDNTAKEQQGESPETTRPDNISKTTAKTDNDQDLLQVMTRPADEAMTRRMESTVAAFMDSLNYDQADQAIAFLSQEYKEKGSESAFRRDFFGAPILWQMDVTHVGSAEDGSIIVRLKTKQLDSFKGAVESSVGAIRFIKEGSTFRISKLQLG